MAWVQVGDTDINDREQGEGAPLVVPGSRCHEIEGAPHNVHDEATDEYNAVVGAFLDELVTA